jgi:O-antigen ligase
LSLTALATYSIYAGLLLAGFWRPILGVLGYLAIYFTYNPNVWWVVETRHLFPRPSFTAMFFLIAASLLNSRKLNWSISRRELEFYLFLGACWLSTTIYGVHMEADNWEYLLKISKIFVFIFFFIRIVNSFKRYKLVIWAFVFAGLFLSYQAHLVTTGGRIDRIGGIDFGEANGTAAFLAITIIFAAFQFLESSLLKKIFYVFAIALMCDTIILTESRAVLIGIAAAVPYVLFRAPPKKFKQIFIYLVLGVIMFINLMDPTFIARMGTIGESILSARSVNTYYEKSKLDRLDYWKAGWEVIKDHPMGIGIKNFKKIVPHYDPRNPGMDVHNTYILCFSEIGIIGFMLFLIIIAEVILQMNRIRRVARASAKEGEVLSYATSLGASLVVYLCGFMMTHSILYMEILWILFSMPICLENAVQGVIAKDPSSNSNNVSDAAAQAAPS